MRVYRPLLGFVLGLAMAAGGASAGTITLIELADTIQPVTSEFLIRGIAQAEAEGHALVVIELDTPGGLVDSTRSITSAILESEVPVAVYVSPRGARAASAGFLILLSADIAAMAPATNTGAAHPVPIGTPVDQGGTDQVMVDKMSNDLAAMARSIATARGRDVEAAERGVRESESYTVDEALEAGLIDLVAIDRQELIGALDGRVIRRSDGEEVTLALSGAVIEPFVMSPVETFLARIPHPQIVGLLLLAGIVGIGFELTHPGAIFPGVVGAISLLLALYALAILPVNYVGVALVVLAVVLFVAEFNVPSHGLLAIGGGVALVLGSTMLIEAPIPEMRIDWSFFLPVSLMMVGLFTWLAWRAARLRLSPPLTGYEGMIGEVGEARTVIDPEGKVFVEGGWWSAGSEDPIREGGQVVVTAVSGLVLTVRPATDDDRLSQQEVTT